MGLCFFGLRVCGCGFRFCVWVALAVLFVLLWLLCVGGFHFVVFVCFGFWGLSALEFVVC